MPIEKTDIYAGIDGTGVQDNLAYAREFSRSHVHMRFKTWKGRWKHYSRGPNDLGAETFALAEKATAFVERAYKSEGPDSRVFLSGYSRGGAAAVTTARLLAKKGVPIHALLLFDAVDRSYTIGNTTIPVNVYHAFHALRDPKSNSRTSFGNCGTTFSSTVRYISREFFCTHGGVGGTPWLAKHMVAGVPVVREGFISESGGETNVTYAQDVEGAKASGAWMEKMVQLITN